MNVQQGKKWQCPTCSKPFNYKSRLAKHLVTHDLDAKVKCKICGKISKNFELLSRHIKTNHTDRKRPSCNVCHKAFFDPRSLRDHFDRIHCTGERPRFQCTFPGCEKTYLIQCNLSGHVRTEHSEIPVQFPCTLCGKGFKLRGNLEKHISSHTTEKPFHCATCGRSFAQMHHLKRHEETHLEKSARKIFTCELCPLTFSTTSNLRAHVQVFHENLRNYPCTFCDKRFSTSSHLKRHVEARHPASKEKIHSCDKCEYRSHSKRNLANHKKRHEAKERECYFCGKKFFTFQDLVGHCGRIHTLEKKLNM